MVNIIEIGDLVASMEKSVYELEQATNSNNTNEVNRLRILIISLQQKIEEGLTGKNV